jgi:phenylalanyl-tRNA synthetase beta subunit
VAFGLRFGAGRTLKDSEVDRAIEAMMNALNQQYNAELRK